MGKDWLDEFPDVKKAREALIQDRIQRGLIPDPPVPPEAEDALKETANRSFSNFPHEALRPIRWEYKAINIEAKGIWNKNMNEGKTVKELNKLGAEGWEVVASVPINRQGVLNHQDATYAFGFILKRPVQE